MTISLRRSSVLASLGLLAANLALGQEKPSGAGLPTATEILEKSQQAFYYTGADMRAKVRMDLVTEGGNIRTRLLVMLRKNDPQGRSQKYFLYFHEPGDIRRTAFLIWKYPEKNDDRWIFIPAVNMVRRVAASDSRTSFVGSDFTYEDVSGRDLSSDTHTLLREERQGEAECYLVQSVPRTPTDYTRKLSWIDKVTFLPYREEYYDAQNELVRVFTAETISNVTAGEGAAVKTYPTVMKRTMKNIKSGHRSEVTYLSMSYDVGLDDAVFTESALRGPPQKWIR